MGGSSLAPGGHLRDGRRRADGARLLRPGLRRGGAGRPAGPHASSWSPASPAARSRPTASAARTSRRSRDAGIDPAERIVVVTDPGSPLDGEARDGRLHRRQRRPGRRRPLLGADRVRAGAERAGRRRHRRGCSTRRPALEPALAGRRRGQPGAAARRADRRRPRRRRRQAGPGRRRLGHRRLRRLGRAADRRVHRQARQGRAAGRGRGRRRAELPAQHGRLACSSRSARGRRPTADQRVRRDRSPARSARRCCCGSTPSRSPAGSSGSTRSTSRTSRAPRRRPAGCSDSSSGARPGRLHRRRHRGPGARRACSTAPDTVDRRGRRAARRSSTPTHGYLAVMAYLDRARRRLARRRPGPAGPAYRPAGDVRLGAAVPALDRAVPQGRPADRGLPAGHRRRRTRTSRCPGGRSPSAASSPPRPPATPRCSPTTAGPVLRLHLTDRAAGLARLSEILGRHGGDQGAA